jgi:hypothetical protein
MALPNARTFNTIDLTAYTPSVATSPVAAYVRVPTRSRILKFTGILGGAITTADGTITVANVTQGTTIGTFAVTQAGSAAGLLFSGAPSTVALSQCNEDDVLSLTPSGASGAAIPIHFSISLRTA